MIEEKQIERWHAASLRLGFKVFAPCKVKLSDGSTVEATALVMIGPPKGMVVDPQWKILAPYAGQLMADGYGFSAVEIGEDDASLSRMLQDWVVEAQI